MDRGIPLGMGLIVVVLILAVIVLVDMGVNRHQGFAPPKRKVADEPMHKTPRPKPRER